jgi:hypothetical protein
MARKTAEDRQKNGRFAKGNPGGPGRPRKSTSNKRTDSDRRDGWVNALTGVGTIGYDKRTASDFRHCAVDRQEAQDLWLGNPLAARIVETWPNEMLREGFDVVFAGDAEDVKEQQEQVETLLDEIGACEALHEGLSYERAYGGGAILIGVTDHRDLSVPLIPERVRSLDWLTTFEPHEIYPQYWYNDPRAPKFGKPEIYQINTSAKGPSSSGDSAPELLYVHESRLIAFNGIRVSRHDHAQGENGWGGSVLSRVYRILVDHGMGFDAAAVLLNDFAQAVYKISGLGAAMAEDRDDEIKVRTKAVELSRSFARAVIIDAEDEFGRQQTPITGMPEMLDRFSAMLAAAADMPLTLLMGQPPSGMNATGESDIRFFYDRVGAMQKKKLTPAVKRLVEIALHALKLTPEKWTIEHRPLWQESNLDKSVARLNQAKTDEIYIGQMVYSPEDCARSRFGTDHYSFETSVDFAERERLEQEAKEAEELALRQSIESAKAAKGAGGDGPPDKEPAGEE